MFTPYPAIPMSHKVPVPGLRQKPDRPKMVDRQVATQRSSRRSSRFNNARTVFKPFSRLPKELRVLIWKFALPDPKVLELCLRNRDQTAQEADREVPVTNNWADNENWQWVSVHITIQPVLHLVCREAHEVFHESYDLLNAYDRSMKPWRAIYWDYSRDCFYFARRSWELLSDTAGGRFPSMKLLPMDSKRTRYLAINSHVPQAWIAYKFPGNQQFTNPGGREIAVRRISRAISIFTCLEILYLVIDGRGPRHNGTDALIPAGAEQFDFYIKNGREDCLAWIPGIIDDVAASDTALHMPQVCLNLLVHKEPLVRLERRWDYSFATCRICRPEFTGHRYISRSPTPESESSSSYGGGTDGEL